jgi:Tol biopolymer transport system component
MPLSPGTRLGPYEIVAPLGAGGMGEVFRATDTRLGREVAIKVLPQHLSANAEVRARFEREAKTVSSLNHPHICTLFDVGREADTDYLVLELVDGETLAQRLEKGALPAAEVLRLGGQIADALDRAHRAGVIHRDLKPGNVMLTRSGAKLMDFGLARATGMAGPAGGSGVTVAALTQSPTVASPLTAEGTIVGTFQYMAPEQLEGKDADARSDLWALGCVLYEMATGRRAFDGRSQASLIASILKEQPRPLTEVAPMAPPGLDRAVKQCLTKDPDDRWQTAGDLRRELLWLAEGGSQAGVPAPVAARRRNRASLATMLAAVGWLAAAVLAWRVVASRGPAPAAVQSLIEPPRGVEIAVRHAETSLSPDGRVVVFCDQDGGGLWIRPLGSDAATHLEGTEKAFRPFWSPDSRTIAYFVPDKLMRVPVSGGSPTTVCDASSGRGGSWGRDGTILLSPALDGPIMRVPAAGGTPIAVTTLDTTRHERGHRFPCLLPDGEHFLFASLPGGASGWDTYVGSLHSRTAKRLLTARSVAVYADPGYLLFERDRRVLAQRFDTRRLELQGAPVSIAEAPEPTDLDAEPVASASGNGRLAILRSEPAETRLEIRDATGATQSRLDLPPGPWKVSRVSPDGRRATAFKGDELWVVDLARSVPMRLASDMASLPTTAWSPDGNRIAFAQRHNEREEIFIGDIDGHADLLPTTDDLFKGVCDWSRDGRYIVIYGQTAATGIDLWIVPMDGDRKPVPYLREPGDQVMGRVSPDGHWLAYMSNETGQHEIYVQSFPRPGHKVRVSLDGGGRPRWVDGGRRLTYLNPEGFNISVPVQAGVELLPGASQKGGIVPGNLTSGDWFGDTGRSLVSVATNQRPRAIRLIQDWTALLPK